MLGLLEGGEAWAWNSPASLVVLGAGSITLVAFILVERRVAEPGLPLWVFTRRDLLTTSLASFGVGTVMIGFTSYVPTFTQVSLGTGALVAGFSVATMTVGWPVAASNSGRLYLRFGFRFTSVVGSLIAILGVALMLLLDVSSSPWEVAVFCLVVGLGLGLIGPSSQIAAQQTVGWSERGVSPRPTCSSGASARPWASPSTERSSTPHSGERQAIRPPVRSPPRCMRSSSGCWSPPCSCLPPRRRCRAIFARGRRPQIPTQILRMWPCPTSASDSPDLSHMHRATAGPCL